MTVVAKLEHAVATLDDTFVIIVVNDWLVDIGVNVDVDVGMGIDEVATAFGVVLFL